MSGSGASGAGVAAPPVCGKANAPSRGPTATAQTGASVGVPVGWGGTGPSAPSPGQTGIGLGGAFIPLFTFKNSLSAMDKFFLIKAFVETK